MNNLKGCSRRQFFGGIFATSVSPAMLRALSENRLAFASAREGFHFDTGDLRGSLRQNGRSAGLLPVFDCASGTPLASSLGLFSHYRLLDDMARYGTAAWDWASEATLCDDGAVEAHWLADDAHPFDMRAVYRWTAPNTLDLTTRVTASRTLRRFEVFLASYFDGFPETIVYAKEGFISVPKSAGVWHIFPHNKEAVTIIEDGRWKRPPHPVEWAIRSSLAAPLAVRHDAARELAAVIMARAEDCFAVAAPHDEEGHRSVYLSLFGRDFKAGESASARSRLVIGRGISDEKAIALYNTFRKEEKEP